METKRIEDGEWRKAMLVPKFTLVGTSSGHGQLTTKAPVQNDFTVYHRDKDYLGLGLSQYSRIPIAWLIVIVRLCMLIFWLYRSRPLAW